ncbi:bc4ef6f8-35a6-4d60-be23-224f07a0b341 [Sclerotinia trifoliorum]|uniref:Bc4ef6f8-35a6-4d60-be23-224f07a0b341 n=1 Tax=Sclerotinia trifoliorum TaxID=28548 RepID=A0A8H2ZM40_9HELO|nr:bc4ef6f8-35a6-4d60-be23-224f07a0b341 [Sclerotinia trifoliorum]
MPRHRKKNGIFDSYGLPKPIIEVIPARTTASASTRPLIEYQATRKQSPVHDGHKLTQCTLMPELAHGLTYTLPERRPYSLEHISALKRACKSMARYFKETSITSLSPAGPVNSDEVHFLSMGGRVMFVQPIAMYKSPGPSGKTFGVIRLEGEKIRFKAASGWGKRDHDDSLRDNEFCSAQVLQFCNSLGFHLPGNCWDKTEVGRYAACHVEKKLILMLVLDIIYDAQTGDIAMFRLDELWERGLRAQIYIDKDPCHHCQYFARLLTEYTGIEFTIITAKNFVEAEWSKADGKRQLQRKHAAPRMQSQLFKYPRSKTKRPEQSVDYSISVASTSCKSRSGGKRDRMLDDDDENDETFCPRELQPKIKRLHKKPRTIDKFNKTKFDSHRSGNPTATYDAPRDLASCTHSSAQQLSTKSDMKSKKIVSPLDSKRYIKVSHSRGTAVDHYSTTVETTKLHGKAVPSERSRAIAELQQAKESLLPIEHKMPVFHCVPTLTSSPRIKIYRTSNDLDTVSLQSSRTASPEGFIVTPPEQPHKALPSPVTTPLRRHTHSLHSESINGREPIGSSASVQSSRERPTPIKFAVSDSRPAKRVISRSIDLTTPEPSPLSKIKQYQYTPPPSKTSKHRSEKEVLPIPFRLSNNKN